MDARTGDAHRIAALLGAYALLGGLVSLNGWVMDVPELTQWDGNGISIQPNAAIAAMAAGAALILLARRRSRAAAFCGGLAGLIGAATLCEHLSGAALHIDTLLTFDRTWGSAATLAPGRMGPPGAVSWTLVGAGVLLSLGGFRARRIAAILAVGVSGVAMLSIVGSLFGVDPLHTLPRLTAIAMQTATFILAAGLGLIAAMPEREPMRTLMEDSGAGILVRRALPILVVLPVVFGYLRVKGQRMGLFDTGMGTAVLVVALIAVSCTVLWWCVRALRGREDALRESEARLTAFLNQLPLGVGMFNAEGRWIILNPIMRGFVRDRMPSRDPKEVLRWRSWAPDGSLVEPSGWPGSRALRGEMVNPGMDFLHKHDDGTEVWTRVSAAPFRNRDAEILGAVVVVQDISDVKLAAEALREADRRKDEFVATLAHELRNPLAPVRNSLELLKLGADRPDLVQRAIGTMDRQVRTMVRLIDDLLDVNRITRNKLELRREPADLASIVRDAVETVRPLCETSGHQLEVTLPPDGVPMFADPVRLTQVFGNLLMNACKYTDPGGRIHLAATCERDDVVVTVTDSGRGISAELLPHVFNMFTQVDRSLVAQVGGLGIGLSLVKRLVEMHGGTVGAHSGGVGCGSEFTVRLPLPAAPQVQRSAQIALG